VPRNVPSSAPTDVAGSTIEEMLELMVRQISQVITWTHAEGFVEAYSKASPSSRNLFQTAAFNLSSRAGQLRRG
jgi:hypothetical protein